MGQSSSNLIYNNSDIQLYMKLSDVEPGKWSAYNKSIQERFWSKVKKTDSCWIWERALEKTGYGEFLIKQNGKWTPIRASRLSYLFKYGEIPEGMCVCHHCDTPACVNPDHLFLGTHTDNMRDSAKKGRLGSKGVSRNRGEKNPQAKLTEADVHNIKERIMNGEKQGDIAKDYGMKQYTISDIKRERRWKGVD